PFKRLITDNHQAVTTGFYPVLNTQNATGLSCRFFSVKLSDILLGEIVLSDLIKDAWCCCLSVIVTSNDAATPCFVIVIVTVTVAMIVAMTIRPSACVSARVYVAIAVTVIVAVTIRDHYLLDGAYVHTDREREYGAETSKNVTPHVICNRE
ncbi:MAG: hypothetical protein ABEH65_01810, partial [Halobacteriales archaeon]